MKREDKQIEELIKWLDNFFKLSEYEKEMMIMKINNEDINFGKWLNTIKNIENKNDLYKELRGY